MKPVVFAGPSIHGVPRELLSDFSVLPPATCGDVARAARSGATTIALIDGRFETTASVWHKELLWALSNGVQLLGSSSMGALRAAEMWPFGMQGVGAIYRLYRRGALVDDDEVALLHGPPETGFAPLTESMINVRMTLRKASRSGIITLDTERQIVQIAKSLFYKDRTYGRILDVSTRQPHLADDAVRLGHLLDGVRFDLKRADAIVLLSRLHRVPKRMVTIEFPRTTFWDFFERQYVIPLVSRESADIRRFRAPALMA